MKKQFDKSVHRLRTCRKGSSASQNMPFRHPEKALPAHGRGSLAMRKRLSDTAENESGGAETAMRTYRTDCETLASPPEYKRIRMRRHFRLQISDSHGVYFCAARIFIRKKRINLQKHINGKICHVRAHKPRHKRKIAVAGTHITQKGDPPFGESPIIRLIHQLHLTTTLRMLPSDILTIFIPLSGLLRRRPSMP